MRMFSKHIRLYNEYLEQVSEQEKNKDQEDILGLLMYVLGPVPMQDVITFNLDIPKERIDKWLRQVSPDKANALLNIIAHPPEYIQSTIESKAGWEYHLANLLTAWVRHDPIHLLPNVCLLVHDKRFRLILLKTLAMSLGSKSVLQAFRREEKIYLSQFRLLVDQFRNLADAEQGWLIAAISAIPGPEAFELLIGIQRMLPKDDEKKRNNLALYIENRNKMSLDK